MLIKIPPNYYLPHPVSLAEQKWREGTMPLVSIFCITYNHSNYIRQAIEGFLNQKTVFPVEIIVHDDASVDGTAEIVREYEKKFPEKIIPIYQKENQFSKGMDPFINFLIPQARGKYVAVCEGDDYWIDPLKLQKQVGTFNKYPDTVICGARAKTWSESKKVFTVTTPALDKDITCMTPEQLFFLGDWVKNCTRMIPRELFSSIPREYMMDYRHVHYLMAKNPNGTFRCLDEIVAVYREHAGGVFSGADLIDVQKEYFESTRLIARLFPDERAVIMRENASQTAKGLFFARSLRFRERFFYAWQYFVLTLGNFSYLGMKRIFNRFLFQLFTYLNRYPSFKRLLRSFYEIIKRDNRGNEKR